MNSLLSRFRHEAKAIRAVGLFVLIFSLLSVVLPQSAQAEGYYPSHTVTKQAIHKQSGYHIVQQGDTLRNIAIAYGTTTYALAHANGLHDINRIEVGHYLYISYNHGNKHEPSHPPKTHPPKNHNCAAYHVVRHGESLSLIAEWFKVDPYYLAKANNIYDLNHIAAGQKVCIPGGKKEAAKPTYNHPGYKSAQKPTYHKPTYYVPEGYTPVNPQPGHHYVHPTPAPTPVPPAPSPASVAHPEGWTGSYFSHTMCYGTPLYTRHDAAINFNWGSGGPGGGLWNDQFSVSWSSNAYFQAGTYRFYATVDDGVRVYVDNHLIIDSWKEQAATTYFHDIYLSEGHHDVRVDYFEQTGDAVIKVNWGRF